jgi:putative urate catabolism protein
VNYEEGGENCLLHGDQGSEHLLSEIIGAGALKGERSTNIESLYEYGSRAGFWRLLRLFNRKGLGNGVTCFGVGMAMERNPEAVNAMVSEGWELSSHGYRWIDYQNVEPAVEDEHIKRTIQIHENLCGSRPSGIYQGKPNENTRRLVVENGFLWDNDCYNDDLPHWNYDHLAVTGRPHLVIPYTLDVNDMRYNIPNGFNNGGEFFTYLKDALDTLLEEGSSQREGGNASPKMMSVGLHCRIVGKPGRIQGLSKFLDYVASKGQDVWVCRREEIANHWYTKHYPKEYGEAPVVPMVGGGGGARSKL